jgi:hypothetical protein
MSSVPNNHDAHDYAEALARAVNRLAFGTAKRLPFGPADASAGLNGSHLREPTARLG